MSSSSVALQVLFEYKAVSALVYGSWPVLSGEGLPRRLPQRLFEKVFGAFGSISVNTERSMNG